MEYIESYEVDEELWVSVGNLGVLAADILQVVMEFMNAGSLYDIVKLRGDGVFLKEEETAYCIHSVLEALAFLHKRNRIHRDIKVLRTTLLSTASD